MSAAVRPVDSAIARHDAIIIGAGVNGMLQLLKLRELGLDARVLEAGSDVGGTWYWNRYPGCRFDSESYSYIFSFSQELLDEWGWSEHFSAQPETLRYCNFLADRFDLRRSMTFDARVVRAVFDETRDEWDVETDDGRHRRARYLVTAVGPLSIPVMPNIPGIADFRGESWHTGLWPKEPVDFAGKRVAVIGTGASGVQLIQTIASEVEHLTVFQRRPNWCAPLNNAPISKQEMVQIRRRYPEIFRLCFESEGGFMHVADPRKATAVSAAEREALFEELYRKPGFAIWLANFYDTFIDPEANRLLTDFMARKIRERVDDKDVAEMLIPVDHGFGTRRVPMESGYYEVFNRDNVELVSLRDTPIDRITEQGLIVDGHEYAFDMIIYATGFDAMLGAYNRMEIVGRDGMALKEKWDGGPQTFLGLLMHGFPNLMMIIGPHTGASFCNMPRCGEETIEFLTGLIDHAEKHGRTRIEPDAASEREWTEHVHEVAQKLLINQTDSWFTGINRNLEGRQERVVLLYAGGATRYRARLREVIDSDYRELGLA